MATKADSKPGNRALIILGVAAIILLTALPLVLLPNSDFAGSDGKGAAVIETLAPDYNAGWITNWWTPPSTETESALFALQAAAGGILIGYFFGYMRGRKASRRDSGD